MSEAIVYQLRVTCVTGPWLDNECVRFIEMPALANLYDLHVAIQDAVDFDEEFPFYFFTALAPESGRFLIPEDWPVDVAPADLDPDVYEDCPVFDYVTPNAKESLFYSFGSGFDDWVFKVQHTGIAHAATKGEFYPLVLNEISVGPDPEQYGSGFDDFAETEEEFQPDARPVSDTDFNRDDEDSSEDNFFGFHDEDEDEDEYASNGDDDEDDIW